MKIDPGPLLKLAFVLLPLFLNAQQEPGVLGLKPNIPSFTTGFVKNAGRFRTSDGQAHPELLFKLPGAGTDLYVTTTGLSYVFRRLKQTQGDNPNIALQKKNTLQAKFTRGDSLLHYEIERVDMRLENAQISLAQATLSYQNNPAPFHYYAGGSRSSDEQTVERIYFHDIYRGIDWQLYINTTDSNHPVLKQDFILHAGADTRMLRSRYSSNTRIIVDSGGRLQVSGRIASFEEKQLLVYEKDSRAPIPVKPRLHGHLLTYEFPEKVTKTDVVLDPVLFWGTYLTSTTRGIDYNDLVSGNDLTTDANGNIFVQLTVSAGVAFPTINPGGGAYYQDVTASPYGGMVIMKFNRGGVLQWSTFFGPSGGMHIATDPSGHIYASGIADNGSIPLLNNGGYFNSAPQYSFLARFANDGQLEWSTYGFFQDWTATDMKSDGNGNIFIAGRSSYLAMPQVDPGGGAYIATGRYAQRAFIMQLTPDCKIHWSTQIDGLDYYTGSVRIAFDELDHLLLGVDGNVMRFDGALNLITTFGAGTVYDLAVDRQGDIFVVGGGMSGFGFPFTDPGGGAFMDNSISTGKSTGYIMKFSPSNQLVWATTLIKSEQTYMSRVLIDPTCDAIHVLGFMNDISYQMPTIDNNCSNGFYYPAGSSPIAIGPVLWTFKTSGQQIYTTLTDFGYEYYYNNPGFAIDPYGSLILLFGDMRNFNTISAAKDPGNGAFYQPTRNNLDMASFLMKLAPSPMQGTIQITNPTSCTCDGFAAVSIQCGTPPFIYQWSNGATTASVTGLCSGDYSVQVTDNLCKTKTFNFTIQPGPGSITSIDAVAAPSHCAQADGAINISSVTGGSGPYTYSLNGGPFQSSPVFNSLPKGKYQLQVKDQYSCPFSLVVEIPDLPGPNKMDVSMLPTACNQPNGSLEVTGIDGGTAPFSYQLNASAFQTTNQFSGLAAGNYTLQIVDAAGCSMTQAVRVDQTPPPSNETHLTTAAHCGQGDGILEISAVTGGSAPYTYSLDGIQYQSGSSFTTLHSGTYRFYIQDSRGCTYSNNAVVPETAGPAAPLLSVKDAVCDAPYGSVAVSSINGGVAPYQYSLDNQALQATNSFQNVTPGSHSLSVSDAYGCQSTTSFQIIATHATSIRVSPKDTVICYGQPATFTAAAINGSRPVSFDWDYGQGTGTSYNKPFYQADKLILTATNNDGCISSDTAFIEVKNCDSTGDYCVRFANAFTPNNDGNNDTFGPIVHCQVSKYQLQVYNRYGTVVFTSASSDRRWNGSFSGRLLESGSYIYICKYTVGTIAKELKGTILLIR